MRPPIVKAWHRTTIQFRGNYSNRYGVGEQTGGTDLGPPPAQGDNYGFGFLDTSNYFYMKDQAGSYYYVEIYGDPGSEIFYIYPRLGFESLNYPPYAFGRNYVFTPDLKFQLRSSINIPIDRCYDWAGQVSNKLDNPTLVMFPYTAMNIGSSSYRIGPNFVFQGNSFYLRYGYNTPALKPWIVNNAGTYSLSLTVA